MNSILRVLSLNVWGLGYNLAPHRAQRVQAIGEALEALQLDLVGLQEVWLAKDRALLARLGHDAGLRFAHYFDRGIVGSGLMVLSRYPILETAFHQFQLRARPERIYEGDYYAGKGIGLARIQTPTGIVDFYTTHAIAQYEIDAIDPYAAHRAGNMVEIARFVNQHSTDNPAILTGDFNVPETKAGYHLVRTLAHLDDPFRELHPDDPGYTHSHGNGYCKSNNRQARLDYVFLRDGAEAGFHPLCAELTLTCQRNLDRPYSDHYGVLVEVVWQATSSKPTPDYHVPTYEAFTNGVRQVEQVAVGRQGGHLMRALIGFMAGLLLLPRSRSAGLLAWGYALIESWLAAYAMPRELDALRDINTEIENQLNKAKKAIEEVLPEDVLK